MTKLKDIYLKEDECLVVWLKSSDGTYEPIEISVDKNNNKEVKYGIGISGRCILGMSSKSKSII